MRLSIIAGLLLVSSVYASTNPWQEPWQSFEELSVLLKSTPRGRAVWEAAERQDPEILKNLKVGQKSLTESTYTRTYTVPEGREVVSIKHEVSIAEGSSRADAVLDLAHELIHFSRREIASPYDPSIRRDQFIRAGIEGPGGELDAFVEECRVGKEMEQHFPGFPKQRLCAAYWLADGQLDVERVRKDFYAAGTGYQELRRALGAAGLGVLPELSGSAVAFRSSYAGVAYPLALSREFDQTIATACRNNERKARVLASVTQPALTEERQRLKHYQRVHCGSSLQKR